MRNALGRQLRDDEIGPENLDDLTAAVQGDALLSHLDRLQLLDMCNKLKDLIHAADEVTISGRKQMDDEMEEHGKHLEQKLDRQKSRMARGLQSSDETEETSCARQHQPLQLTRMAIAMSLPFTADITFDSSVLLSGRVSRDLLGEFGFKPYLARIESSRR